MRHFVKLTTVCLLATAAVSTARADIIYSNSPAGDVYSNAGASNQGQAVGSTGWYYNNVRNSGSVGINGTAPKSGNGSVSFKSPSGAAKADIEFLGSGTNFGGNFFATGSLGKLSNFSGASYDWLRDSSSTNSDLQNPSFRLLLDRDGDLSTTNDRGSLIFEAVYNGQAVVPDTWMTSTLGNSTNFWATGTLAALNPNFTDTLTNWKNLLPDAAILGFSSGVGSGWTGSFSGAVDNLAWTINGTTTTNNFELATEIPEPATMVVFGTVLAVGVARFRRRQTVA